MLSLKETDHKMGSLKLITVLLIAINTKTIAADTALEHLANSSSLFAIDLFKTIAASTPSNLITSPLSADVCLSMVAYGASGNTATQMRNVLHLSDNQCPSGFRSLISTLNNVTNVELRMANKIYIQNDFEIKPAYKALTTNYFLSTTEQLDFSNAMAAATTINTWCEQQTNNRIKDVITSDDLDADTKLVMLNAVYFKGNWSVEFASNMTQNRPFYMDNAINNVSTMFKKDSFRFGELEDLDARFVELPYKGNEVSMIIVCPNQINGLKTVEDNLHKLSLTRLTQDGRSREVELYLPKFKAESTIQLTDILKQMGMTDMFTGQADFSGIATTPLRVSKVIQKAFIEVNEKGSEAAAVTAVIGFRVTSISAPKPAPLIFRVDRPFHYMIAHKTTKTILFSGSVRMPPTN